MLGGQEITKTPPNTTRCAFDSIPYSVSLGDDGVSAVLWETMAFDDSIPEFPSAVVARMFKLIRGLEENGVSLLILNYDMIQAFCMGKVPIAIVGSVCGTSAERKSWWSETKESFSNKGMDFDDHACIVGIRRQGLRDWDSHNYEAAYTRSSIKLKAMIKRASLSSPWHAERREWLKSFVSEYLLDRRLYITDRFDESQLDIEMRKCGFSERECMIMMS
ncbi:hypothetical protein HWV62_14692 [Athelia sp. TMB]|nr:hypothetical protein HWV62_14692 [Athelia sp. TMB]